MYRLLLTVLVFSLLGAVHAQGDPPDTVDELNVGIYLGRWYQVHCLVFYTVVVKLVQHGCNYI